MVLSAKILAAYGFLILSTVTCSNSANSTKKKFFPDSKDQDAVLAPLIDQEEQAILQDFVIFGDSLSDTGLLRKNTFNIYLPENVYWHGRMSNGPIWVDYVCRAFACKLYNYAVSGAATRFLSFPNSLFATPLNRQIASFLSEAPVTPAKSFIAVIWIGANNYFHSEPSDPQTVINDIREAAIQLLQYPGLQLVISNLTDISVLPASPPDKNHPANVLLRKFTREHNIKIYEMIGDLQRLHPDKKILLNDSYSINQRAQFEADFGFKNTRNSCYDGNYRGKFKGEEKVCDDPSSNKHWDTSHPTTRMHCYFALDFMATLHEADWLPRLNYQEGFDSCRKI